MIAIFLDTRGSQAGIKFATPMLVVPTSNFFKKSNKVYLLSRSKDNKVWIRWWSQANYSQNQTLFIVNYEGFSIDWLYTHACTNTNLNAKFVKEHTGHTIWKSTVSSPIITLQFRNISATRKELLLWKCFNIVLFID